MTYTEVEDRELVRLAKQGDKDAFSELYTRYHSTILAIAYRRVRLLAVAQDLASDTFLRAFHRLDNLTVVESKNFRSWVATIAHNLCNDYFKKAINRVSVPLGTTERELESYDIKAEHKVSAEEEAIRNLTLQELRYHLQYALRELTEMQYTCISHRFFDGLSVRDTALKMGLSEGSVKSLQTRATARLRKTL